VPLLLSRSKRTASWASALAAHELPALSTSLWKVTAKATIRLLHLHPPSNHHSQFPELAKSMIMDGRESCGHADSLGGESWKSSRTPAATPTTKSSTTLRRNYNTPSHFPWIDSLHWAMHFYHLITSSGPVLCQHLFHRLGDASIFRSARVPTKTGRSAADLNNTTIPPHLTWFPIILSKWEQHKIDNQNKSSAHWLSFYRRGKVSDDGVSGTVEKPHEVI